MLTLSHKHTLGGSDSDYSWNAVRAFCPIRDSLAGYTSTPVLLKPNALSSKILSTLNIPGNIQITKINGLKFTPLHKPVAIWTQYLSG